MPSSDFRIPNQMLVNNSLSALQQSFAKLTDLQDEASSLKRLSKPSDAPGRRRRRRCSCTPASTATTSTRATSATRRAGSATPTTRSPSIVTQLQQVNDLVVQASNASTRRERRARASRPQIDSIRQSLIGVANTQYAGRPIFAGTAGGDAAYDANGQYVGVSSAVERNIAPGQRIQVNVNGDTVFGSPGNDLFTHPDADLPGRAERPEPADRAPDHAGHPDDPGPEPAGAGRIAISSGSEHCRAKTLRMG